MSTKPEKIKASALATVGQFIHYNAQCCPHCLGSNIDGGMAKYDGIDMHRTATCTDCGLQWHEYYTMVSYSPINVEHDEDTCESDS